MSLPLALTPGTVIDGHYIVGDLLNSGGFGAVYRGIDTSEGNRPCAIKETYDVTPAARRQALMEASVLFTVRSKHLPEVYDALEANGRFYLVMQLIEGRNLLEILRARVGNNVVGEAEPYQHLSGPCTEQEVLNWLLPIMDVLQELHSRNPPVMHRDIKPGNIILTPQQAAVLVDFGLTRLYDPNSNTQTLVKAVSAGFSPIEQYMGKTSPRSDIYAMAATMYLLLTNRLPPAAIHRSMQDGLIAPHLLNPTLSTVTERALLKALALDADQRYQSMGEFARALQEPAFTAYADPTIAVAPVQSQSAPSTPPTPSTSSIPPAAPAPQPHKANRHAQQNAPAHGYAGAGGAAGQRPPGGASPRPAQQPYAPSSAPPSAPPGFVMVPQATLMSNRPLPSPFGQGCLMGVLQGVLAALLVVWLKKEAYFYLAILMGFIFYVIAGFSTVYRGGGSLRGARAGFWAGITSTVMFWVVLGVGLLFRLSQQIQADTTNSQRFHFPLPRNELGRAWSMVLPDFLKQPAPHPQPGQSPLTNLLILAVGGLVVAIGLGWIGGMLGKARHKTRAVKRKHP